MLKFKIHSSGFFSTLSLILGQTINYYNSQKKLPEVFDDSDIFLWYKKDKKEKIYKKYFIISTDTFPFINDINFNYGNDQFKKYKEINIDLLTPFINKYFQPSEEIKNIISDLEKKYNIDYSKTCALFLRGNDKNKETKIPNYNKYLIKGKKIKDMRFLIQSDESEFLEEMSNHFENNFIFKDEIRHIKKDTKKTVDNHGQTPEENFHYSKYFLAIVIIMSRCKYVICNTGNISLWIALYRGNTNNLVQF